MQSMKRLWFLCAALVAVVPTGTSTQSARPGQEPVTVEVNGPLILGFFPPFTKAEEDADDGGISEGLAHMRFALEDIEKCNGDRTATYRLDITRSVTLRDGKRVRTVRIPRDWRHAVGIILAAPGRPALTVFASDGPSSLIQLGPSTVADYFGATACRSNK
jgi:hypothetical protein